MRRYRPKSRRSLRLRRYRLGVEVIYQTVADMHKAIPIHNGDWYFTGDYPTPGGNVVSNKAFVNFYENRNERAY